MTSDVKETWIANIKQTSWIYIITYFKGNLIDKTAALLFKETGWQKLEVMAESNKAFLLTPGESVRNEIDAIWFH